MALRIAVLLSGSGTTLESLLEHRAKGLLDADIAAVLSSRPNAYGLERARRHGIPAHPLDRRAFAEEAAFQDALHAILDSVQPDLPGAHRTLSTARRWNMLSTCSATATGC